VAVIRIDNFAGVNLRQDPKKGAFPQVAENVDLDTNSIVATWGLDVATRVLLGTVTERKTIYNLNGNTFLSWTQDVQVAANPLADDSDRRVYYTGDGEPRVTDYSLAVAGATPYPCAAYVLGIPAMPAISTRSASTGGTGLDQDRAYVYTYVTPWGEEGPPSEPISIASKETGATVQLERIGTSPRNSGSTILQPVTFIAVPSPGFLEYNWGATGNPYKVGEGDRVNLCRGAAGAPGPANHSFVISTLGGAGFRIAANCWPAADNGATYARVLPMNSFPINQVVAVGGETTLKVFCADMAGLRVGEQVDIAGSAASVNGRHTLLGVAAAQDSKGATYFEIAWDGSIVASFAGTVTRVAKHNTGEVHILGISFAAGIATLTLESTAELEVGDRVLIIAVMGAYEINGVRPIASIVDATHVTIAIAALTAYTVGGMLIRPIPFAFDEYSVSTIGAAAGGAYPVPFTTTLTLDRDHDLVTGDLVVGYDIGGAIELNTVLAVSAVPATNQITVSMATTHTAFTAGGSIAVVERQSKKRIYRTSQGTTDAEYQLVDEIPSEQAHYTDILNDAHLSSTVLETDEWIQPPVDLHHIQAHPHGFLQGLSGNVLCQSVPRAPHAWPISYQKPMPVQSAVALGITDKTAIVVTTEKPYAFVGADPQSMSREVLPGGEPCTSATSLAVAGASGGDSSPIAGVAYRGRRGVLLAAGAGAQNLTEGLLPASFFTSSPRSVGAFWAGKYVWVDNSAATGYILDPRGGDHALTSFRVDFPVSALHVSPVDGQMWAAYTDATNIYAAPLFKITGSAVRFTWQSEYRYVPKPVSMAYLQVDFDWASMSSWMKEREAQLVANMRARRSGSFNTVAFNQSEWNAGLRRHAYAPDTTVVTPAEKYLRVTVIANPDSADDRVTVFDDFVSDDRPIRVDDGVRADVWQVQLLGNVKVSAVTLASTMNELRNV
jgi:hypothetical protein